MNSNSELNPHWLVVGITVSLLVIIVLICHYFQNSLPPPIPEEQRIFTRTLLYVWAIVGMPLTNLIRHVQLRLNETMPGIKPAKHRYFLTVLVSMSFAESIGIMGLVMFWLGDGFNTLYIFTLMSALAIYLYRPKMHEYLKIKEALAHHYEQI